MKFEWRYNKQTEIERLIFTAGNIARGYYQQMGFLITEIQNPNSSILTVIFPKLKLSPQIWTELSKKEQGVGGPEISDAALSKFSQQCSHIELIPKEKVNSMRKSWGKIEKKVAKLFEVLFPDNPYQNVVILPTKYGTVGSHHAPNANTLHIAIRDDQPVEYIVSLILKVIVQLQSIKLQKQKELLDQNKWTQKESAVDFIMTQTAFKQFAKNYTSILDLVRNPETPEDLIQQSNNYYASLGFPVHAVLKLNQNKVSLYDKPIENLSPTQAKILKHLLEKEGAVVTFDELAEIMWGSKSFDSFSLTAMSKMIFQLRDKLKRNGLQKEVIFTKRGQGYTLIQ